MKDFLCYITKVAATLILLIVISNLFLDDESSVSNRQYIRYNSAQINELIFALNQLSRPIHG